METGKMYALSYLKSLLEGAKSNNLKENNDAKETVEELETALNWVKGK